MSPQYRKRIEKALEETKQLLAKELRYSPDLQKQDRIEFYNSHIVKLENYLTTDVCVIHGITY